MAEDVASSLAVSIVMAFGGSAKRRKNNKLPQLEPAVAMTVLENLLRDPCYAAARTAILCSEPACAVLEEALHKGTVRAERVLSGESFFNESDVELVLRACEMYGRFALHKEATRGASQGLPAKVLLDWTTNLVIPALQGAPFRDSLNLSRISAVTDDEPTSPIAKRTDRKKTPSKLDTSIQHVSMDLEMSFSSPSSFSKHAAVSLLQSSCIIFAEWLAVGGSGAPEIAAAASEWCVAASEAVPAFWRLALQLGKASGNVEMVGLLLGKCEKEDEAIRKTISALLTSRQESTGEPLCGAVLKEIIKSARVSVVEEYLLDETPYDWKEVWGTSHGMVSALAAVGSNKKASIAFAELLVAGMGQETDAMTLFFVRCLWRMSETNEGIQKAVRNMDASQLASETAQDLVDKMVCSYS